MHHGLRLAKTATETYLPWQNKTGPYGTSKCKTPAFLIWGEPLRIMTSASIIFSRRFLPITASPRTIHRQTGKIRSEEHTSELQSPDHLVCRLLLEKKKTKHTSCTNSDDHARQT